MAVSSAQPYAEIATELKELIPPQTVVFDAHTHLGADEDGRSLDAATLTDYLEQLQPNAQACVFAFNDPERHPAYRRPNDRVLEWARESEGRLIAFCRLDPADDPVAEAQRCLSRGARGIKLHPRAQSFGFEGPAAEAIFATAAEARVPVLIHAGRGMPPMDALVDLAWRHPEVPLILAHAAIADQGLFATRLADHPATLYDTSCFSPLDVMELFGRVPVERIVFGSDAPYGRPTGGLYLALRACAYAGLSPEERNLVAGETMRALVEGRGPAPARPPRLPEVRPVYGSLARVTGYLIMAFAAALGAGPPPQPQRALPAIDLARAVCRDPAPGLAGPALERIDRALQGAVQLIAQGPDHAVLAIGLVHAAATIAATEPVA